MILVWGDSMTWFSPQSWFGFEFLPCFGFGWFCVKIEMVLSNLCLVLGLAWFWFDWWNWNGFSQWGFNGMVFSSILVCLWFWLVLYLVDWVKLKWVFSINHVGLWFWLVLDLVDLVKLKWVFSINHVGLWFWLVLDLVDSVKLKWVFLISHVGLLWVAIFWIWLVFKWKFKWVLNPHAHFRFYMSCTP